MTNGVRHRINTDPENVEKGLAGLVLTLIDIVRELMERQAVRRIDAGSLSPEEIERLGQTFMKLNDRLEDLRHDFGLEESDLDPIKEELTWAATATATSSSCSNGSTKTPIRRAS